MKQKYSLSKSNKIYLGVIAVFSFVRFIATSNFTSYQLGEFTGSLIAFLLFPSLFAWIVWGLSGRKGKAGSVTFNIVLTLLLLGQIGQFVNKSQQNLITRELVKQEEQYKKEISSTDDPAKIDAATNKYFNSVQGELNKLAETSTGPQKQFYKIMSAYTSESQSIIQDFNDSVNAVLSPRILDYSLLNSDEEFDYQRNILRLYVEKTEIYIGLFANSVPDIKNRLSVLGEGNEYAKGAIDGVTGEYLAQKPFFEPLMHAHGEYGNNMIQILDLLQNNKDDWDYENDELLVYSQAVMDEYNELLEELGNNEAAINTLSDKMVDQM